MKKDPEKLIEVWKELRAKNNVILFLESEAMTHDTKIIMEWFSASIKEMISREDALMKNGSFLCIRKVLETMPPLTKETIGEYTIKFLSYQEIEHIKELLK